MTRSKPDDPKQIAAAVRVGRRYQQIAGEAIDTAVAAELVRGRERHAAVKAARNRLHQVAGAFLPAQPPYADWLAQLRPLDPASESWRQAGMEMMEQHASTRERLPILDRFYHEVLAGCGPVQTVLDLACGLNPLAIPWMPLTSPVRYTAYDIYEDMAAFLTGMLALSGIAGEVTARDVTRLEVLPEADVTLLLKAVPCLDQLDRAAAARLLDRVRSPYVIISFPRGGLGHGPRWDSRIATARLEELVTGKPWRVRRIDFPSELVFRLEQ